MPAYDCLLQEVLHTDRYVPSSPDFKLPYALFQVQKSKFYNKIVSTKLVSKGIINIYNCLCFLENFSCWENKGLKGYIFLHLSWPNWWMKHIIYDSTRYGLRPFL